MNVMDRYNDWRRNDTVRIFLFCLGILLMILAPIIGVLPGPGFLILFPIGLALTLQNSRWAKKRYVAFKKRWPKHGEWTDWGLRRESYKRRIEVAKQDVEGEALPPAL